MVKSSQNHHDRYYISLSGRWLELEFESDALTYPSGLILQGTCINLPPTRQQQYHYYSKDGYTPITITINGTMYTGLEVCIE